MGEVTDQVEGERGVADLPPPPWRLRGSAFALLYRLPREALLTSGAIPPEVRPGFLGGMSALLLADYESSEVGSYRELLFVPGRFAGPTGGIHSVTCGFVSSEAAAASGLRNWGLRRHLGEVTFERAGQVHRVTVTSRGEAAGPVATFTIRTGVLGIPMTTDVLPATRRTILQRVEDRALLTTLSGRGTLRSAHVESVSVSSAELPDLSAYQPTMAVRLEGFHLALPGPTVAGR